MWNIRTRLHKLLYTALPLPLLFVFSGCVKPLKVEDAKINVPNHFKHQQKTTARKPTLKYWEDFRDPTLNQLVEKALTQNSDLKNATLRIQRDFQMARIKWADFFPTLATSASLTRLQSSLNTGQPIGQFGIPRSQTSYNVGFDFGFEIDFWGRLRNQYKAAKARTLGSYYWSVDAEQKLIAEVLKTYFALQWNELKNQALKEIQAAQTLAIRWSEQKLNAGLGTQTEVLQFKSLSLNTQNELELNQFERARLVTSLAVLVGETPSLFSFPSRALSLESPSLFLPHLLPSDLIRQRPDIQAAETELVAANALTQSALAEFFPKFTFKAQFGVQSLSTSDLFSQASTFFSLGPAVSFPIFDFGRNLANYRARKTEREMSLESYKKTVLTAFKEVEDRLAEFNDQRAEFKNSLQMLAGSRSINQLSLLKNESGLTPGYEANQALIDYQRIRILAGSKKLSLLQTQVELIRSFGGGLSQRALSESPYLKDSKKEPIPKRQPYSSSKVSQEP